MSGVSLTENIDLVRKKSNPGHDKRVVQIVSETDMGKYSSSLVTSVKTVSQKNTRHGSKVYDRFVYNSALDRRECENLLAKGNKGKAMMCKNH